MTLDCSPNDPFGSRGRGLRASSAHCSSPACKCSPRRYFPHAGAQAACELFALLEPSAAPPKGFVNALVAAARGTREDEDEVHASAHHGAIHSPQVRERTRTRCMQVLITAPSTPHRYTRGRGRGACKCSPRRPPLPTGTREDEDEGGQGGGKSGKSGQGGQGAKGGATDGGHASRDAHVAPPCMQVLTTAPFPHRCVVCRASEPMLSSSPYRIGRRHVAGSSGLRGIREHRSSQERHVFTAGVAPELAGGGGLPRSAPTDTSDRAGRQPV